MSTAVIALFPANSTAWDWKDALLLRLFPYLHIKDLSFATKILYISPRFALLADLSISTVRHKDKLLFACNKTVVPGILLH